MLSKKISTVTAAALLSATSLVAFASMASAQETASPKAKVHSCVGAAEHKQAQGLRLQALDLDMKAAQARLAEATAKNKPAAVARISARIAKINARIAQVKANQVKLTAKCP